MSRIGKKPLPIPTGVQVTVNGAAVTVKGPRGELTRAFDPSMRIERQDSALVVHRPDDEKRSRAMHGLTRTLIQNMLVGVTAGYQKSLEIVGVGYRATQQGTKVLLQVGYSKPVEVEPPAGIQLQVEGQNRVHVRGIEKEKVGLIAANIRKVRPPNRYKGKGIRYVGEVVQLKPGKGAAKKTA